MLSVDRISNNNFDLLRVLFAITVFFVHTYILSGSEALAFLEQFLSSKIAVQSFFIVSGFLIFMSYEKSKSVQGYFVKRVRRVYPAYFSIVLLCAILGVLLSSLPVEEYFTIDWLKYILANLVFLNFLHPSLPGLFNDQYLSAVNGALWTLKIEVMFYALVPIVVWMMNKWGRLKTLVLLYVFSHVYVLLIGLWGSNGGLAIAEQLQRQLPGQLSFFIAGAILYYYFDFFKRYAYWLLVPSLLFVLVKSYLPALWLEPITLSVIIIYLAYIFPFLGHWGKYGDFSYGIYIVHFPVLQTLIALGLFAEKPFVALLIAILTVFSLAFLFWHFIEKPFLKKRSHYIESSHVS